MVLAILMLGMLRQILPHTRFGFLRKGATKRGIDMLYRTDRIVGERMIEHSAEEVHRCGMQAAELDDALEYLGPVTGGFKTNVEEKHMIAERTLQHRA